MVTHIVAWRLKDSALGNNKTENARLMRAKLEALPGQIPGLLHLEVGFDFSATENSADCRADDWDHRPGSCPKSCSCCPGQSRSAPCTERSAQAGRDARVLVLRQANRPAQKGIAEATDAARTERGPDREATGHPG